ADRHPHPAPDPAALHPVTKPADTPDPRRNGPDRGQPPALPLSFSGAPHVHVLEPLDRPSVPRPPVPPRPPPRPHRARGRAPRNPRDAHRGPRLPGHPPRHLPDHG